MKYQLPTADTGSGLLVPTYAELTAQSSAPTTPAAGKSRLYVDSNGLLQLLPASAPVRRLTADWGSGTAFPASGVAQGDVYRHTALGLHVYTGTVWRQEQRLDVADAATRDGLSTTYSAALYPGFQVYVTAQKIAWEWDGTGWRFARYLGNYHSDTTAPVGNYSNSNTFSIANAVATAVNFPTIDRANPFVTIGSAGVNGSSTDLLTLKARGLWVFEGFVYAYSPGATVGATATTAISMIVPGGAAEFSQGVGQYDQEVVGTQPPSWAQRVQVHWTGWADVNDAVRLTIQRTTSDGTGTTTYRAWITAKLIG